jgi:hypothetical protein
MGETLRLLYKVKQTKLLLNNKFQYLFFMEIYIKRDLNIGGVDGRGVFKCVCVCVCITPSPPLTISILFFIFSTTYLILFYVFKLHNIFKKKLSV